MDTSPTESEPATPDLSACEREPIHTPSAIEPNGGLLVVGEPGLRILQVSSNLSPLLGIAPEAALGMRLGDLFVLEAAGDFLSGANGNGQRRYVSELRTRNSNITFDALVHRNQGLLIIEFEPRLNLGAAGPDVYASLTDAMAELEGSLPLLELCQRMTRLIRRLTGFDRVMVYRFLKDDSGSVIAEDRREDLIPYLGLHYPASDIPAQARRLYLANTLRLKADVNACTAVLIPEVNPVTRTTLDMTFCVFRAMSPVHVEYLRNMGVAASMSISIVKDGRLWGLIACHHGQAKLVPHPTRITCEVMGRVFSSRIASAEEEDQRAHATALWELSGRLEERMRKERNVVAVLTEAADAITSVIGAQGLAFSIRGMTVLSGVTPDAEQVEALLAWLSTNQAEHVFATERMAALYPRASEFSGMVSGLLAIRIALGGPDFVLWFRPPIVQVIHWAGNPDKPVEETEAGRRISPRRSFETWKQTFRDSSESWTDTDRGFASALRRMIAETLVLQMNEEIVRLNLELARSNVELNSFAYAASHDLQEPVRMIRSYAQLLNLKAGPELTAESRLFLTTIENSAARMGSLIRGLLSYSELGGMERRESKPVNLEDVLHWVLTHLDDQAQESGALITHDALPVVPSNFEEMVQLLQNLVGNAIKYRRPDAPARIHISSQLEGAFFLLSVRDNGQGFHPDQSDIIFQPFKRLHGQEVPGNGIGLATCRRIVELHHGRIWAESGGNNCGATFWFTLPSLDSEQKSAGRGAQ